MRYSREFIEKVRNQASLVDIVNKDTTLKREGGVWKGCCPFSRTRHANGGDTDPSFVVYPAGTRASYENFYCYGCHIGDKKESGYGSDIFEYMRLRDGLMFDEAVKEVANITGIPIEQNEESKDVELLYNIVLNQNRAYYKCLHQSDEGIKYLKERGLSEKSIETWRLGLVPKDVQITSLANRIAIPIFDISGRVCGFGFRTIDGKKPKYLNSPNSLIFKKSNLWYGLYQARHSILKNDCVILVEGYMDVILLHQYGVTNAVACMSASINNLDILHKYTKNVIVWLDGDKTGRNASNKYIDALTKEGFFVKVVDMKGDQRDPADLANEHKDNIKSYVDDNAIYWVQYRLNESLQKLRSQIMSAKLKALPEIVSILRGVNNQPELDLYVHWVSNELNMDPKTIMANIKEEPDN